MPWTAKYWDIVRDFYWAPQYVGLKSIPQRDWEVSVDRVSVPRAMTNPKGPLYRRLRSGDEFWTYVKRQEETFNHIFNMTFAVLPGDVISEIFNPLVEHEADYELLCGVMQERYGWRPNVTAPDSVFLSPSSILAVELKFNARTSLDQLGKYLALFAAEEDLRGPHENITLLYVSPTGASERFCKDTGMVPGRPEVGSLERIEQAITNSHVKRFFKEKRGLIEQTLSKLSIRCATWQDLSQRLHVYASKLGDDSGARTLRRLITGLQTELTEHPLSRVSGPTSSEKPQNADGKST